MKNKRVIRIFCISTLVLTFGYIGYKVVDILSHFAGSYSYSENYTFNTQREDLIVKINHLKNQEPQLKVMTVFENGKIGELPDRHLQNFYSCYFYLPKNKITAHCVINTNNTGYPTVLQFVGISEYANFASWKSINTDQLSKKENKEIKIIFETEILDKLGKWRKPHFWE